MLTYALALAAAAQAPAAPPAPGLRPGLEPLAPLVGHCWRGTFAGGEQDTHCFEAVYGGQHVRDRHEVTGGARVYRGETLYSWDGTASAVGYTYWNSLGGVSRGAMHGRGTVLDFGTESHRTADGRTLSISTHWRIDGDAYEAVTASRDSPSMNRTVRYVRVAEPVTISEETGADGSRTLVHEVVVAAPPAAVWEAVSTAPGWTSWAVPVAWRDPDLIETSYTPGAARGDPSTIQQRIVAAVPNRLLVFRTVKAPAGFPHFETFGAVVHMIALEPEGEDRTRVRLTGSGYADTEAGRALVGFFREGNRVSLERLRQRFASGPVDWSAVLRRSD